MPQRMTIPRAMRVTCGCRSPPGGAVTVDEFFSRAAAERSDDAPFQVVLGVVQRSSRAAAR